MKLSRAAVVVAYGAFGALWVAACSDVERPPQANSDSVSDAGDESWDGRPGTPSCDEGDEKGCHVALGEHDGVLSCFVGMKRCVDGAWGACQETDATSAAGSYHSLLATKVGDCEDNPCDPDCKDFEETPDGGITPEGDGGVGDGDWDQGDLDDFPGGLVNKGLIEPCHSGADCQFNQYCTDVATDSSCAHNKCVTGASLNSTCDSCVSLICTAKPECCPLSTCSHSPCETGKKLTSTCNTCAAKVCKSDSYCCDNKWDSLCVSEASSWCSGGCDADGSSWSQACVDMVASTCDATCGSGNPPPGKGSCEAWKVGEVDKSCKLADLAVAPPCDGVIPVCNHGTVTAPAGIKILHFPANSQQYPSCSPSQSHPQMKSCTTKEAIKPGQCISVTGCPDLNGNREIMVNPTGTGHVDECSCLDNWSLYSGSNECGAPSCQSQTSKADIKPVVMYFMVDRSGSMVGSKWTGAVSALTSFFSATSSAGISVAMEFFPLASGGSFGNGCAATEWSCGSSACASPMVSLGTLTTASAPTDTAQASLVAALTTVGVPVGGTPTYPALDGSLSWAQTQLASDPNKVYAVVLVTDGEPTWCNTSVSAIAGLAESSYLTKNIRTYTVGMDGADVTALNQIAAKGGTGQAFVISGANSSQIASSLLSALQSIAGKSASCEFELDPSAAFDPGNATVKYTSGSSTPTKLTRVADGNGCGSGWYFNNPAAPTKVTLCPTTCATIKADTAASVEIDLGCPASFEPVTVSKVYEATCPTGKIAEWRYFAYDTAIPADGSVVFQTRVATTQAGLANATWVPLATASVANKNAVCAMAGPSPCPIDLSKVLGEPNNGNRFLELNMTINPASSGTSAPVVNDWKVTYSCPAGE